MKIHHLYRRPLFSFAMIAVSVYALAFTGPVSGNGMMSTDSELTLLMRQMYDDVALMKAAVKKRKKPVPAVDHARMLTAKPSDPSKTASPAYGAFAEAYLKNLKALQSADVSQAKALYKDLIDSCISCHSAFCPGPKMRIVNLY